MVVNGPNHPGAVGSPPSKLKAVIPVFPHLENVPLTGWRDVIVKQGPEGWAKAVRAHPGLLLTDTTMRDAHQSLLATRMRTYDMIQASKPTAQVLLLTTQLQPPVNYIYLNEIVHVLDTMIQQILYKV